MKKTVLAVVAAFAFGCATAQAADMPVRPVFKAAAPAYNWAGLYGGFALGYAHDPGYSLTAGSLGTLQMPGLEPAGPFIGLLVGQNFLVAPQWLFGWEADFQYGWIRDYFSYDSGSDHIGLTVRHDMFGTLRGRWGFINGPSMFFTTAGLAYGRFAFSGGVRTDTTFSDTGGTDHWEIGYVVGAGWEQILQNNWRGRFEYQFIDFGSFSVTSPNSIGGGVTTLRGNPEVHVFKIVFVRPFGTP